MSYMLKTKVGFSLDELEQILPYEKEIYLNMFIKEQKEKRDALQNEGF